MHQAFHQASLIASYVSCLWNTCVGTMSSSTVIPPIYHHFYDNLESDNYSTDLNVFDNELMDVPCAHYSRVSASHLIRWKVTCARDGIVLQPIRKILHLLRSLSCTLMLPTVLLHPLKVILHSILSPQK